MTTLLDRPEANSINFYTEVTLIEQSHIISVNKLVNILKVRSQAIINCETRDE